MKAYTSLLLLMLFILASCSKEGRDDVIANHVPVVAFHTINIDGVFKVYIVQDSSGFVTFTGTSRHVATCTALVSDCTLTITGSKHGEFLHPGEATTEVYVHVDKSIKLINVNEDCILRTQGALFGKEIGVVVGTRSFDGELELNCRTFYYWNNPNGTHLNLIGFTQELKLWNTGLGSIDASQLASDYVLVENGAQNDCKVKALQKLEFSLTGVGNIVYFGNPPLIVQNNSTGTGTLIKGD